MVWNKINWRNYLVYNSLMNKRGSEKGKEKENEKRSKDKKLAFRILKIYAYKITISNP